MKYNNIFSLSDLLYLGLKINDHSVQSHENSQYLIYYFSSAQCVPGTGLWAGKWNLYMVLISSLEEATIQTERHKYK